MFPGTEKREFSCSRCKEKDGRRKFLAGESRRNPYSDWAGNDFGIDGEDESLPQGRWNSNEPNFTCKRCAMHHEAYNHYMESDPSFVTRARKIKQRGHAPPKKRGRNVLSQYERSENKRNEESLSIRFWDSPVTDCRQCQQHHGLEADTRDPSLSPPPLPKEDSIVPFLNENASAWWSKPKASGCQRCLAHHLHELQDEPSPKIVTWKKQTEGKEPNMSLKIGGKHNRQKQLKHSRTGLPAIQREICGGQSSRSPSPGRNTSYRERYERKQAQGCNLWHQAGNKKGISEMGGQPGSPKDLGPYATEVMRKAQKLGRTPPKRRGEMDRARSPVWTTREMNAKELRNQRGPSQGFVEHKQSSKRSPVQQRYNAARQSRSPKWSKECLHTLWRKRCGPAGLRRDPSSPEKMWIRKSRTRVSESMLSERIMRLEKRDFRVRSRSVYPQNIAGGANRWKDPRSQEVNRTMERGETRWAPTPTWTFQQLNLKEAEEKRRSASPMRKRILNFRKETSEKYNSQPTTGNRSRVSSPESNRLSPLASLRSRTINGVEVLSLSISPDRRDGVKGVLNFELIQNAGQNAKLQAINSKAKDRNSRDGAKTGTLAFRSERSPKVLTENGPHIGNKARNNSRKSSPTTRNNNSGENELKLSMGIRSDRGLDGVDGILKQFLSGMGGLVYYSKPDGGIPRIRELANYFSGKQPLLWFFPR